MVDWVVVVLVVVVVEVGWVVGSVVLKVVYDRCVGCDPVFCPQTAVNGSRHGRNFYDCPAYELIKLMMTDDN